MKLMSADNHEEIKLLSPVEVAEILGYTPEHVAYLCRKGELGRKVGKCWVIFETEIEKIRSKPKNGRGKYDRAEKGLKTAK